MQQTSAMRASGIAAVGELPWGSHFCQFYGSRDDLVDSLVPFFKAGLEANEHCLWVTSEPFGADDAHAMLRAAVTDLDERTRRGQIEIIDHRDWYMRSGDRTAAEVLRGWVERHDRALAAGWSGLRLTGNTYWLERKDWKGFVEYESHVSETFAGHNIIGLCSYCSSRCSATDVLDVVRNHQFALARDAGEWQLLESTALKTAKEELRRLNLELERRVEERTAELENALRVRDEFLSIASHELKTPITSLQLFVLGLQRAYDTGPLAVDEARARLDKLLRQCGRLDNLINNLLDVSRASRGTLRLEREELDLHEVVESTCERMREDLARAGSTLTVTTVPVHGRWDRLRVEQVITNLLSNAAHHAPSASVAVSLEATADGAVLTVRDDGPGIAARDRERIFERFVQVTPSVRGFGLGLWIVKRIAAGHGGDVRVESEVGNGASFIVTLPRAS